MNISRINMSPSFGQVKRSAARKAIYEAFNDMKKLNEIKSLVKKEQDNYWCDVVPCNKGLFKYAVVSRDNSEEYTFVDFEGACKVANRYRELNEGHYSKLATQILAECEE